MDSKGYYKTLGVKEDASQDEIKKVFKNIIFNLFLKLNK